MKADGRGGQEDGKSTDFAILRYLDPFVVFSVSLLFNYLIPRISQPTFKRAAEKAQCRGLEESSYLRSEEVLKNRPTRALRGTVLAVMQGHCSCILARRHDC